MVHTCGAFWWSVSKAREGRLHGQPWPAYSDRAGGGPSCLPWRHDIGDGNEAAEKLNSIGEIEIIVLDWHLPGVNGIDLCKKYRDAGGSLPVLMLTGRHGSQEASQCKEAGASKYLPKPFQLEELTRELEALLSA